jgi:hypothetical protein
MTRSSDTVPDQWPSCDALRGRNEDPNEDLAAVLDTEAQSTVEPPTRIIDRVMDAPAGPVADDHSMKILEYVLAALAVTSAILLGLIH